MGRCRLKRQAVLAAATDAKSGNPSLPTEDWVDHRLTAPLDQADLAATDVAVVEGQQAQLAVRAVAEATAS